jgi:uncharacterized protein YjbJ (UPF0337 family)
MKADEIEANWDLVRDEIRMTWDELTDDEVDNIDGDMEELYGLMWEKYGKSRHEFDEYLNGLGDWIAMQFAEKLSS